MQFLADILDAPVDRPVGDGDDPALGAAYLAGFAAGLCPDLAGFAATWKCERPLHTTQWMRQTRQRKMGPGWQDAGRAHPLARA